MDLEADMLDAPTQNDTPKSQYQKNKKVEGKVSGEDNDNEHHHGIQLSRPKNIKSNRTDPF